MRSVLTVIAIASALIGCDNTSTSGGPGAADPLFEDRIVGQADDTFSLDIPSISLNQGETKAITVGIERGTNFSQDVTLRLGDLPSGVTVDPSVPLIRHGDTNAKFNIRATRDAAIGDFTVSVTGRPTQGSEAAAEMKIAIAKATDRDIEKANLDAAKEQRDEYVTAMQKQWDQFAARYEDLKSRAANAEDPQKASLESQCTAVKSKLDAAASKLGDLKSASAAGWEDFKDDVRVAFDDLKSVFA
jgi:hypothetical protein